MGYEECICPGWEGAGEIHVAPSVPAKQQGKEVDLRSSETDRVDRRAPARFIAARRTLRDAEFGVEEADDVSARVYGPANRARLTPKASIFAGKSRSIGILTSNFSCHGMPVASCDSSTPASRRSCMKDCIF